MKRMGLQVFSRRPILVFWDPKLSNWTPWEKNPQAPFPAGLGSACLIETLYDNFHLSSSPDLSDLLLGFWLRGWGFKFSQDVQFFFFETQNYQIGRLEKKARSLDSQRVWAARVWLKHRMIGFICLIVRISRIFSLFFDLWGWGFKFYQSVQLLFFETQNYQIGRLEKKPAGSIPGGSGQRVFDWSIFWRPLFISNNLGSFCIPLFFETIDTTYDLEIISYFSDLGLFPFGNMKFDPTTYELL